MSLQTAKIAFFVIDYTHGGGVEKVTSDLSYLFLEEGYTVSELVSLYQSNQNAAIEYDKRMAIHVLNPKGKKEFYAKFNNYFKKYQPDYFIFQGDNLTISLSILKAAAENGVRAIPQYHGSPYAYLSKYSDAEKKNTLKKIVASLFFPFKKNKLKKFIQQSKYGFVCVSNGIADELRKLFKNQDFTKNITTIRNPIHLNFTTNITKYKTVTFVSRLERKHKNAFLILKTWEQVAPKHPDWKLKIFGTGSLKTKMENFVKEKNLSNVEFFGFSKDLNMELRKSAISVSTSNCEGFSMAVAEAIAQRNAVAITNSDGGIKDMVEHQITGLVSEKNNPKKLAENINTLIENETVREELSNAAFLRLKLIHDENIFEKWIALLKK